MSKFNLSFFELYLFLKRLKKIHYGKKIILILMAVALTTGIAIADKKCCKDKKACKKEACAKKSNEQQGDNEVAGFAKKEKSCAGGEKKACCKKEANAETFAATQLLQRRRW